MTVFKKYSLIGSSELALHKILNFFWSCLNIFVMSKHKFKLSYSGQNVECSFGPVWIKSLRLVPFEDGLDTLKIFRNFVDVAFFHNILKCGIEYTSSCNSLGISAMWSRAKYSRMNSSDSCFSSIFFAYFLSWVRNCHTAGTNSPIKYNPSIFVFILFWWSFWTKYLVI